MTIDEQAHREQVAINKLRAFGTERPKVYRRPSCGKATYKIKIIHGDPRGWNLGPIRKKRDKIEK